MSPSEKGEQPDTWRERISRARECGRFTDDDRRRAARWTTCAVGEQIRHYPKLIKLDRGNPVDADLGQLGTAFFAAILANDVVKAEASLSQIEDRVLELKRQRKARVARTRRVSPEPSPGTQSRPLAAPVPTEREEGYHEGNYEAEERPA